MAGSKKKAHYGLTTHPHPLVCLNAYKALQIGIAHALSSKPEGVERLFYTHYVATMSKIVQQWFTLVQGA